MHRSHTSLVTQGLRNAGLYLGDELIGASPFNPYGHFEDRRVVEFHESLFNKYKLKNNRGSLLPKRLIEVTFQEEDYIIAKTIIHRLMKGNVAGFKDPRAGLFLDLWHEVVPNAFFLFPFRDPQSSVSSLVRRSLKNRHWTWRPDMTNIFFNQWCITNDRIVDFYHRYPDKCHILKTPDDLIKDLSVTDIDRRLRHDWQLQLQELTYDDCVDMSLISKNKTRPISVKVLYRLKPKMRTTYERLSQIHLSQ